MIVVLKNKFPVAYANCSLDEDKRRYTITDLEGVAILWAISHSETYFHGMHFTVSMDYSASIGCEE